ncbi:MAG: tRNA (adenosine(37)-N6)-threonylcarbamoyltransferase complex dimerization subunit type 1 TsaB [Candidatus Saccharibacteria bacterium]
MLILTIRSDKPAAELGLFHDNHQIGYETWEAHRALAETIHTKIASLLTQHGHSLADLAGIIAFRGPGSFTGLRIGLAVANALADALQLPIIASDGADWIVRGSARLAAGENDTMAVPEYGALPHITLPKK